MKSLEERKKERAERLHQAQQETAVSVATRGELQDAAERAVIAADKEAGVESAPLSSQEKKKPSEPAKKAPSPFDVPAKATTKKKK